MMLLFCGLALAAAGFALGFYVGGNMVANHLVSNYLIIPRPIFRGVQSVPLLADARPYVKVGKSPKDFQ